ncbi:MULTISPECIES: helix-turn-helix transcriptional regulator [unclassified Nonomuraea]|uniref:helix-turn-helix domain-containing protein n=1 Tax=unclassified Nonomuraea TaxID=2593643 RepID=UPI0033DA5675
MRDDDEVPTRRQGPPTIRMRRLAAQLRRLRQAAGLSQEEAAQLTAVNVATLYRLETGRAKPQPRTLIALCDAYGVSSAERETLRALARDAGKKGLLHDDSELPEQYMTYINFEAEAVQILNFENAFIPGLLQTSAYAQAVIRGVLPDSSDEEVQTRVEARLKRQALLSSPDRPHFWSVIDEAALHRAVGGPQVMREQLLHLAEQSQRPGIALQVIPFKAGAHPAMPGPFVILRFGPNDPDIVYIDSSAGDLLLEDEAELTRHTMVFEHCRAVALSPDDTTALLTSLAHREHD